MPDPWSRYDLTAARAHDPRGPGRRPGVRTVDVHSHMWVEEAAAFARRHAAAPGPAIAAAGGVAADTVELNRRQEADRRSRMTDLAERMRDVDAMGVDVQVVMPAPGQCYYALGRGEGAQAARLVNEGMARFAAAEPRLVPFGSVPMQDGEAAAAELRHCVQTLGFKGVQVLTNVNGGELSGPGLEPFWAEAAALGALVVIHPSGFTEPRRFGRFYFGNVIGNPLDTTVALHHLIFDGVLERHRALKLLAVHGGGFLPGYSGRMDHAWGARSDARGALPEPPSTYLRRVFVDSVVFSVPQLEFLVRSMGAGQVLMGTDYPYDMADYDPVGHLCGAAGLTPEEVDAVAGGNAARLLGLTAPSAGVSAGAPAEPARPSAGP